MFATCSNNRAPFFDILHDHFGFFGSRIAAASFAFSCDILPIEYVHFVPLAHMKWLFKTHKTTIIFMSLTQVFCPYSLLTIIKLWLQILCNFWSDHPNVIISNQYVYLINNNNNNNNSNNNNNKSPSWAPLPPQLPRKTFSRSSIFSWKSSK